MITFRDAEALREKQKVREDMLESFACHLRRTLLALNLTQRKEAEKTATGGGGGTTK